MRKIFDYWVRDTAIGLLNTAIHESLKALPIDACSAFGAMISPLSAKRYAASDRRARHNWRILRPDQSDPATVDAAMQRLWRSVSRTMVEFSVLDRLWDAGRIAVGGIEHLDAVRAAGKPILVACLHLGNWETIPVAGIRLGHPGSGIYWRLENRFDTRIAVNARERYGAILYPAGPGAMRAAIRELTSKKGPFVVFVDECIDDRVFAPAFGRRLTAEGNIAHVARLAVRTGAEIIPAYCERLGDRAWFKVRFLPPVQIERDGFRKEKLMANIGAINAVIEPIVHRHLDQWYYALDLDLER
jgi:KDO2-lipid IV(A) lauroyltransferase